MAWLDIMVDQKLLEHLDGIAYIYFESVLLNVVSRRYFVI